VLFGNYIRLPEGSIMEACRAGSRILKYIYIYLFIPAAFIRIIFVIIPIKQNI
jgi:hypothetical protein